MKTLIKIGLLIFVLSMILVGCGLNLSPEDNSAPDESVTNVPLQTINSPTVLSTTDVPLIENPIPSITDIQWDNEQHIISIGVDTWPANWSQWTMYVDGIEIPTSEEDGSIAVRPNAPLDQPPDGVVIGSLPWLTNLGQTDFPCCGSLQFDIPDIGLTNPVDYNFSDFGCVTLSKKVCTSEWVVHEGDLVFDGTDSEIIENTKMIQKGNIYLKGSATLTIKNSELMIERGNTPTIHVYIFVDPNATLNIEDSLVYPGPENGGLTCVINTGTVSVINSPTSIHYFDMSDGAVLLMDNSSMIYEIGGLLQVTGGKTNVTDSTFGALGLSVPAGAHLTASGIKSGTYFEHWKVQDLIPEADYELTLDRVTVLEDDFTGELEHGPYERGWIFFLDPDAHVRLSDSELRKVFMEIRDDTATFTDLKIGEPSSLQYRDIVLENIIVEGEWPFTITDSNVTLTNSNYLFLQPIGSSTITLVNSHIVEFIPRNFSGTMIFENSSWSNAGEILGDVDYHSMSNDFTIKGSLKIDDNLRPNLQWKNARVTREFEVVFVNSSGEPVEQGVIKINGLEYETDENGKAIFSIVFDENNFNQPMHLEAWQSGALIEELDIDFFTETPIRLK